MAEKLLQFPFTPPTAPKHDYQVANKKYVDDNAGSGTLFTMIEIGPGATNTAGNWRFAISGTMLLVQRHDGANWITESSFTS